MRAAFERRGLRTNKLPLPSTRRLGSCRCPPSAGEPHAAARRRAPASAFRRRFSAWAKRARETAGRRRQESGAVVPLILLLSAPGGAVRVVLADEVKRETAQPAQVLRETGGSRLASSTREASPNNPESTEMRPPRGGWPRWEGPRNQVRGVEVSITSVLQRSSHSQRSISNRTCTGGQARSLELDP